MKFKTHNSKTPIEIFGTGFVGYITATRAQLTKAFGEPMTDNLCEKTTLEWHLNFQGEVATIYDYKLEQRPGMDEVYAYHIGGHNRSVVGTIHQAFREAHGLAAAAA